MPIKKKSKKQDFFWKTKVDTDSSKRKNNREGSRNLNSQRGSSVKDDFER